MRSALRMVSLPLIVLLWGGFLAPRTSFGADGEPATVNAHLAKCLAAAAGLLPPNLPRSHSVVFGSSKDDYMSFASAFRRHDITVLTYTEARFSREIGRPYPPRVSAHDPPHPALDTFARAMDYGADNGGINLIVTSIDPAPVAELRAAAARVNRVRARLDAPGASAIERWHIEEELQTAVDAYGRVLSRHSITSWEFARALDLYPDRVTLWARETDGSWRRLNSDETAERLRLFTPPDPTAPR